MNCCVTMTLVTLGSDRITQSMYNIIVPQWAHGSEIRDVFSGINVSSSLLWRHNGHDGVSDCLLKRTFRRRSKKTSKLCVTGLCVGNSLGTGEIPAQMAINAENVSIWWRHHVHSGYGLGQWEKAFHNNASSHWLSPHPEWSQKFAILFYLRGCFNDIATVNDILIK